MKGGVGKTTISFNLAHALARKEQKILVVDFDPQANCSGAFLTFEEYKHHLEKKKVVSDIFSELELIVSPVAGKAEPAITLNDMVTRVRDFDAGGLIDLVPSQLELAMILERSGGASLEDRLKLVLNKSKLKYDYVIIDCGPTYSILTNNALKASDYVLIPVKPDPFSARGIPMLLSKIDLHNLSHTGDDKVGVLGIVFSMVQRNLRYVDSVKAEIFREHTGVFEAQIDFTHMYSRALIDNKSIFETNARLKHKDNFVKFADELMKRVEKLEE